jgi:hypothetical protein
MWRHWHRYLHKGFYSALELNMPSRNYLFSQIDADSVQQKQRQQMQAEIANFESNRLLNSNAADLVEYFSEKNKIEVPELLEEEMVIDQKDAQRDVSGDPQRRFYYGNYDGPIMANGVEISMDVPFFGDPQMFSVRPNTYSNNPPQGVVRGNTLIFSYWGDSLNPEQLQNSIRDWLNNVQQHLQWQRDRFRGLNEALPREAREAIEKRRSQLLAEPRCGTRHPAKAPTRYPDDVCGTEGEAKARAKTASGDSWDI